MNTSNIKLFLTAEHACSYLEGETARSLLIDPQQNINRRMAGIVADMGYRRSGKYYYQPKCLNCQACKPIRVKVKDFVLSRRFKRIINKNNDLKYKALDTIDTDECYSLFESYINQRHADGDMYPPSPKSYRDFLAVEREEQFYVGLYDNDKLICVMVIDHFNYALSAVYTFFDPAEEKRSLGTYAVLWQILRCQQLDYQYLYLGFWIADCQKMSYKDDFTPAEIREKDQWQEKL